MSAEVRVVEILEKTKTVQASVTLGTTPRPEAVLFDALANWLAQEPDRRPIVGHNFFYMPEDEYETKLYGVLILGEPLDDDEEDDD